MMNVVRSIRVFFVVGLAGPLFYLLLLACLGLLWSGYDPVTQSMSEIGGVASPFKNLMNYLGFSLLGIVMTLFGVALFHEVGRGALPWLGFALVLIAGAFMFAVGFFPCDPGCIDVTQTGRLHSLTSTVPAIALPLAAIVMATPITRRWGALWGWLSFGLGMLSMASGPIMFLPAAASMLGLVQRLGIGLSLLWMVVISVQALRATPGPAL